ncbi:MAG: NAD(+) synthase, partial [Methanomethylophilus sp.]
VSTPAEDYGQVRSMCRDWRIELLTISVQPAVDAFTGMLLTGVSASLERGNLSARCRMVVLYNQAKKRQALVVGTTNRSELMTGYMTKFGDGAEDLMPLCRLYKTQIWEMARIVGVPEEIVKKVPTAGLWEGQTDESEMGITYHNLDLALNVLEHGGDDAAIAAVAGITPARAAELRRQVKTSAHKRQPAAAPAADPNA